MSSEPAVFFFILASFFPLTLGQLDYGTAKIGEACQRDYHCIQHAFCRVQLTCLCDSNYLPTPDFSACIASVGLHCANDSMCASMSNGECRQNVCACRDTFEVDITNSSNCLAKPVATNDRCQRNDDCIIALSHALCINSQCQCLTAHHFVPEIGQCVQTSGIYQICSNNYNCYDATDPDLLECRDTMCKCKPGKTAKICNGASSISATMSAVLLLFFAKFLT